MTKARFPRSTNAAAFTRRSLLVKASQAALILAAARAAFPAARTPPGAAPR